MQQPPGAPNAKNILLHIERLQTIRSLALPEGIDRLVHQYRLLKLAREGGQMTIQHLCDLERNHRHATVTAVVLRSMSTLIDQIIDMHDRILTTLFSRAKKKHGEQFHEKGKAINYKMRLYSQIGSALLNAKLTGADPFEAIEAIVTWDLFTRCVAEAETLAQPEDFDYLHLIGDGFTQLRRYTPVFF